MNILGIDPGATTGWCVYDTQARRVLSRGSFPAHEWDVAFHDACLDATPVIERPKGYGPTRPELVDCGYVCGRIVGGFPNCRVVAEMTRIEVKNILRAATHGEVPVKNDAGVWAALKVLHGGDGCDKKGGPLHGVRAHERAALAVAVALSLREAGAAVA